MKKIIILLILCLLCSNTYAQNLRAPVYFEDVSGGAGSSERVSEHERALLEEMQPIGLSINSFYQKSIKALDADSLLSNVMSHVLQYSEILKNADVFFNRLKKRQQLKKIRDESIKWIGDLNRLDIVEEIYTTEEGSIIYANNILETSLPASYDYRPVLAQNIINDKDFRFKYNAMMKKYFDVLYEKRPRLIEILKYFRDKEFKSISDMLDSADSDANTGV